MSCPSKMTLPVSGVANPPRMRRVVVLPQPLGPSSVTNSFSWMVRFSSSKTICPSKDLEMLFKWINSLDMDESSVFSVSYFVFSTLRERTGSNDSKNSAAC